MTLTSFPAHIRDFKNLKGIWHQILARFRQLQSIFGLLKPLLHGQILICFVDISQNDGVGYPLDVVTMVNHISVLKESYTLTPSLTMKKGF